MRCFGDGDEFLLEATFPSRPLVIMEDPFLRWGCFRLGCIRADVELIKGVCWPNLRVEAGWDVGPHQARCDPGNISHPT